MGKLLLMIFVNIVFLRSVGCIINVIREKRDVDRVVEKEMAQLKAIRDEKEQEKMSKYKKQITSLEELHQVIDALEILNKKYVITKRIEVIHLKVANQKYPATIWYVEEVE